jgi:antirestriction protein ArdC
VALSDTGYAVVPINHGDDDMPSTNELRQRITTSIIEALETGNLPPWRKPWRCDPNAGMPTNVISKKRYSGVNVLLLETASMQHRFESKHWATYKQWSALGGQVKKRPTEIKPGHWGTTVIFWSPIKKKMSGDTGEVIDDRYFIMKSYTVFNVEQVDGDFDHLRVGQDTVNSNGEVFEEAEVAITAIGADIRYGGNRAFYAPSGDFIQMPLRESFSVSEYYETLCHELVHWTEPAHRLAWDRKNEGYAMGELIAELGGCFMCSELGLPTADNMTNHAAYLKNWLTAMKGDPKFIFKASTQASKAVDYLLSFSRREIDQPEPLVVI